MYVQYFVAKSEQITDRKEWEQYNTDTLDVRAWTWLHYTQFNLLCCKMLCVLRLLREKTSLWIWRIATYMQNNKIQTANKEWSSCLGLDENWQPLSVKKLAFYVPPQRTSIKELGYMIVKWIWLAQERVQWHTLLHVMYLRHPKT
jgi:hypothetical protein